MQSPQQQRRRRRSRSRSPSLTKTYTRNDNYNRFDGSDHKKPAAKNTNEGNSKHKITQRKYWNIVRRRKRQRKARKRNFEQSEHHVMVLATQEQLQSILQDEEVLCDIPYDCTLHELKGEIALANGSATTLYVQRDGLSTLTIVLPQENPNIANLRRAIEATARIQQQREQRQRNEDRMRRRNEQRASNYANTDDNDSSNVEANQTEDSSECKQVSRVASAKNELPFRSAGELVYSEALSGQQHRENVSWRFLWRAYALLNVHTKQPLNDTNGRTLLSECGIENAATLKFCNREKYFGKIRQKAKNG